MNSSQFLKPSKALFSTISVINVFCSLVENHHHYDFELVRN